MFSKKSYDLTVPFLTFRTYYKYVNVSQQLVHS